MKKRTDFLVEWALIVILIAGVAVAVWDFYLAFTTGCIPGKNRKDHCWDHEPIIFTLLVIGRILGAIIGFALLWLWRKFSRNDKNDGRNDIDNMTSNKG